MDANDFRRMQSSFERFSTRFGEMFARQESARQMAQYLRALLLTRPRRTGPRLADTVGDATSDKMQRLLYLANWDADTARDILQDLAVERLVDDRGGAVLKQVCFAKKGSGSVGVATQWNPGKGRMENCQIAALLVYVNPRTEMILDRRLFLPQEWIQDAGRRRKAKVPASEMFRDMPEIALCLLKHACSRKIPVQWVSGDKVFGDSCYLRNSIRSFGLGYVLEISPQIKLWMSRTEPGALSVTPNGFQQVIEEKHDLRENLAPVTAAEAVSRGSCDGWHRCCVGDNRKDQLSFDWTAEPVREDICGRPGPTAWLLTSRFMHEPSTLLYHLASVPAQTPPARIARVAATIRIAERAIDGARQVAGLDQYHVRHWHSWHRHVTLSMMAYGWLKLAAASAERIPRPEPPEGLFFNTSFQ